MQVAEERFELMELSPKRDFCVPSQAHTRDNPMAVVARDQTFLTLFWNNMCRADHIARNASLLGRMLSWLCSILLRRTRKRTPWIALFFLVPIFLD